MAKRKNKKNKKLLLYTTAALVALMVVMAVLEKFHITNFVKSKSTFINTGSGPTAEEQATEATVNAENKQQSIANSNNQSQPATNSEPAQSIDLSATQDTSTSVTIFSKLYNFPDGTCDLSITNGDKSFTNSAAVIYQTEFSSCAGFSIPVSSLGTGSWLITLRVTSSGKSTTKTISLKVT